MGYLSEFRLNWRALAAASLGLAVGYTFINYVTNIFSPFLIADLGWQKSDFALLGLIVIVAAVCQPVAGRLADLIGVRRMALIGVIGLLISLHYLPGWEVSTHATLGLPTLTVLAIFLVPVFYMVVRRLEINLTKNHHDKIENQISAGET